MKPAYSVILLTTLIGAGQGIFLAVFGAQLVAPSAAPADFVIEACLVAAALTAGGLVASFFHLGRPERAWRAASQWRTSWLSREVIALPAFLACVLLYAMAEARDWPAARALGTLTLVMCLALFACTGMVYAGIRFLREWASPLTLVNFFLLGTASGTTLASAMATAHDPRPYATAAVVLTVLGFATRMASLIRNDRLRPVSTLQSAIGVKHPQIAQKAQGFMGGSFNTREFFHGATAARLRGLRLGFLVAAFIAPTGLLGLALGTGKPTLLILAFVVQFAGLLSERWYFLADANHPQNLYYQAMS